MNEVVVRDSIDWGLVLFVLFLVLKLTGVIGWSWWWVIALLVAMILAIAS